MWVVVFRRVGFEPFTGVLPSPKSQVTWTMELAFSVVVPLNVTV